MMTIPEPSWRKLANPFLNVTDSSKRIVGRVSGRSKDISKLIIGGQSAVILTGTPRIGKSSLIRILKQPPGPGWSWRAELPELRNEMKLDDIHFAQIDLRPLETVTDKDALLGAFIDQCILALQQAYTGEIKLTSSDLKGLRQFLREISQENPDTRYFLMLDNLDGLDRPGMHLFNLPSHAQTSQERGIALLDHCNAIRTLVDLLDEFANFGVLFAMQSLPRPRIGDQFKYVSADLARFTTMTLQTFTRKDALAFPAQSPENFGSEWATMFKDLGGTEVFSVKEREWMYEQAGSHPYLLHQFCFHTFYFKQEYANISNSWAELEENVRSPLLEEINARLTTFLTKFWKRVQDAIEASSPDTRNKFSAFVGDFVDRQANDEVDATEWEKLGAELRYILCNEGIVRYDPFQRIYYPGAILASYLQQKAHEISSPSGRGFWVSIIRPGKQRERFSLPELEHRLLKALKQNPLRCSEEVLMQEAWGKIVEKQTFTQRMHHLRKRLRERCDGEDPIENHYGGEYSLNYSDWFHPE